MNYKAGGGKGGGMPFVTTQCCGNASFLFCFFNKWATVTESRLLSVFLSYRKKIQRLKKKKKKERVKKMQIEKD